MAESTEETTKVADVAPDREIAAEPSSGEVKADADAAKGVPEAANGDDMPVDEATKAEKQGATEGTVEMAKLDHDHDKEAATDDMEKPAEQGGNDDDGEKSASRSPEHKRRDQDVSLSAHDRDDRRRNRGGYGGRGANKRKARFEDQPESNDPEEIRRQVEFYFSDSNLPIDAYLLDLTGGHRNRPVPLKVIHGFKRMRHFQPYGAVRAAVKESPFLNLTDDDELTRKMPLDERFTDDSSKNRTLVHTGSMPRSIYAKGFGDENDTTHLDIEAFFDPYGPISSVRLRRKEDGEFKGSVFVEFHNEEAQHQFLELDPKPQWNGKDLDIMSKQEYVDMKHQGIIDGDVKPKSSGMHSFKRGGDRGGHRGGRGRGRDRHDDDRRGSKEHYDKDDWRARRDRDNEGGRREGGGRGHGRGRGRGGRGDRGGRRRSPDFRDRDRKRGRRDEDDNREDGDGDSRPPKRAEAEADKAQKDTTGDAKAGVTSEAKDDVSGSKKRAREDDGEGAGEAKKAKEETTKDA